MNTPYPSPKQTLPTMYDLPSEEVGDPGLPDEFHLYQAQLLKLTFQPATYSREEYFVGCDINLYYDPSHHLWYKRPDWFAVVGVSRLYEGHDLRLSYVCWQEQVNPFVLIEFLSPGTEDEDLGETQSQVGRPPIKWDVYEQTLQVPYYIVFSRYTEEVQIFRLTNRRYVFVEMPEEGFLIPELGLTLKLWYGSYDNINRLWIRWFNANGELILTPEEVAREQQQRVTIERQRATIERQRAEIERQRAEIERQRAETERQRAEQAEATLEAERQQKEQLRQKLQEMGIDLDSL